jgi:predicted DNA-binding antitoxin AbrB/MazE fold protein
MALESTKSRSCKPIRSMRSQKMVTIKLEAIYENGLLRPLSPLALPEHARVRLAVDDLNDDARAQWLEQSGRIAMAVWDNPEDDVFNELLAP